MEEQEQNDFIAWLKEQLQATDDDDLQQKVSQLGEEGIKKAHVAYQQSKTPQYADGGKLNRLIQLKQKKN
jgi:hypothetical protein